MVPLTRDFLIRDRLRELAPSQPELPYKTGEPEVRKGQRILDIEVLLRTDRACRAGRHWENGRTGAKY
ncbi:hypothetical protein GCM10023184_08910 [Flaviaesturariibacter amylovorans]|uniref:Uncharacterized protein n=1 Tax=Flaviaesturariibacter amylovorans TaxID=1084520 RepID=A0ABP8GDS9_9BACT